MSESGVPVYLNTIPNYYRTLNEKEVAAKFREEMKEALLREFEFGLQAKVSRMLEMGGFGPLPIFIEFVKLVPELFKLYTYGLFHSAVALGGVVAERLCHDIIQMAEISVDGRSLTSDLKEEFVPMSFADLINKLAAWNLISRYSQQELHKIRSIRNRYVHVRPSKVRNPSKDAKKVIECLLNVVKVEFGPSMTGRFIVRNGRLERVQSA